MNKKILEAIKQIDKEANGSEKGDAALRKSMKDLLDMLGEPDLKKNFRMYSIIAAVLFGNPEGTKMAVEGHPNSLFGVVVVALQLGYALAQGDDNEN